MKKLSALLCAVAFAASGQVQISSTFYGGNLWFAKYTTRATAAPLSASQWTRLKAAGMTMMREGGKNFNVLTEKPTDPVYYVDIVDDIRKNGIEPMITVPLEGFTYTDDDNTIMDKVHEYAAKAAEIVRLVNVVNKRNVIYWILANEPGKDYDLYETPTNNTAANVYDASVIARYVKEFSVAMKQIDPNIKIIAPELEYQQSTLLTELFINAPNNIKGTIPSVFNNEATGAAAGKQFIDYLSVHGYSGFNPSNYLQTRGNFITEGDNAQNDFTSFYTTWLSGSSIKLIVDEFNIDHKTGLTNPPANYSSINVPADIQDVGRGNPNSFISGQLLAEKMIGMMAATDGSGNPLVKTCNVWSTTEGGRGFGILHNNSGTFLPKPTYWHYWMLGNFFKGTYYKNVAGSIANGVKAYSCKASNYLAVLVINENTSLQNITFSFNSTPQSTSGSDFAFGMTGSGGNATGTGLPTQITATSTFLIFFNCSGGYLGHFEYSEADQLDWTDASGTFQLSNYSSRLQPRSFNSIPTTNLSVSLSNNGTCMDQNLSATATANPASSTGYTWYKMPKDIYPTPLTGSSNVMNSGLVTGQYEVNFTGGSPCGSSSTVFSVFQQAPLVNGGPDKKYCTGTPVPVGDATLPNATTYNITYSWLPNDVTCTNQCADGTISTPSSTTYQMSAQDASGCKATDNVNLTVLPAAGDVIIKDSKEDIGAEPNGQSLAAINGWFWLSQDIWVRNTNDGLTNQYHQNPENHPTCTPNSTNSNYVYVRLTNIGCQPINNGTLKVYWAKAGTGIAWGPTNQWSGYNCNVGDAACNAGLACGNLIGTITGINVPANSEVIEQLAWCPPDPSDYSTANSNCGAAITAEQGHFCLLAHFDQSPNDPLPSTLQNSVWDQAYQLNNVAWKNVEVIDNDGPMLHPIGTFWIRNVTATKFIKLRFVCQKDNAEQTILDYSRVRMHFSKQLVRAWKEGGQKGRGIILVNDSVLQITRPDAFMDNIFMKPNEVEAAAIQLTPFKKYIGATTHDYFNLDIIQSNPTVEHPDGGVRYSIVKKEWKTRECFNGPNSLSGHISGIQTYSGDQLISGDITVTNGATLQFNKAMLYIAENVSIKVMAGGKLILNNTEIQSACPSKKWAGIFVKGNFTTTGQFVSNASFITDADSPISIEKTKGISIDKTTFLGFDVGTAITLDRLKDFDVTGNTFSDYAIGVKTTNTQIADVRSLISKNIFLDVKTAIDFSNDNHSKLDIQCNKFFYSQYAINSLQTTLKDQGSLANGAGNEFVSSSTMSNDKLRHVSGNNPKYYYDPSEPITSGMNISTIASSADPVCYAYTFDTSAVAARFLNTAATTKNEGNISKQIVDLNPVPNPNTGVASIYYNLGGDKTGELTVRDIYGKTIDRIRLTSETEKIDVNYNHLAEGVYMISIINAKGQVITRKMVISK